MHLTRFFGVLASASKHRAEVVPTPEPDASAGADATTAVPKGKGCRYWPWYLLKARTFGPKAVACPDCNGELTLRAMVKEADAIHRILNHLGLPTDIPRAAPARAPP